MVDCVGAWKCKKVVLVATERGTYDLNEILKIDLEFIIKSNSYQTHFRVTGLQLLANA